MVDNTSHLGGLLSGIWLGAVLGPKFMVTRELDIPEGSMIVPDNAAELMVVLDQRSSLQRSIAAVLYVTGLTGAVVAGAVAKGYVAFHL